MTIRLTSEEDIPRIRILEEQCFPDPWSTKSLRDTLREEHTVLFSAEEEGTVCAYLSAAYVLDEMDICRICVLPEFRRRGLGRLLLTELFRFCRENKISRIFLEVRESNSAARKLYESCGFAGIGMRPGFYQNPDEAACLMKADISQEGSFS